MTKAIHKMILFIVSVFTLMAVTGCYVEEPDYKFTNPYGPLPHGNNNNYAYNNNDYTWNNNTTVGRQKNINGRVIIVDAGHGGKDPGTSGNGVREKDINLTIARKLGTKLQEYGARVVMTRNSDIFIELDDRAAAAEKFKADLLVSVHADYIGKSNINGATILVGKRASQKSKLIAQSIQSSLLSAGIECRGVRSQGLRVCDGHSRPAVLVETGFLSNYSDAKNLKNGWYQSKLADAVADGIAAYLATH